MKTIQAISNAICSPQKNCSCSGACTGYATQSNCPPLIVMAVAAVAQGHALAAAAGRI